MSVVDSLLSLGVLLVALILVREAARWVHLRSEREGRPARCYWEKEKAFDGD